MLSKNNKILIGCLALLLVMSVGYALFSDTITINGTATAKGNFDITATCQTGIAKSIETVAEQAGVKQDGGYQNDTCSVEDDVVSLNTEFLYPGARRNYTVKLTNTGSIDAVYEPSKATRNDELCVSDSLEEDNFNCSSVFDESKYGVLNGQYEATTFFKQIGIEDPNGNLLSQSELLEFYDPATGNVILKPEYSAYIIYTLSVDHINQNVDAGIMNIKYTGTFTLPFTQITN